MNFIAILFCLNLLFITAIFVGLYIFYSRDLPSLSRQAEYNKRFEALDTNVAFLISSVTESNQSVTNLLNIIKDSLQELKIVSDSVKEVVQTLSSQHDEYHDNMLEKLNKAGELIINWENFYENTLLELDDIVRFVEVLSKRNPLTSDPDFANFFKAVQLTQQTILRYSTVAAELKKKESPSKTS